MIYLAAVPATPTPHWAETWIPGSVGLLITGIPLFFLLREVIRGYLAYGWATAPAEITESRKIIRWPSHRIKNAYALISYRYEVNGQSRVGNRIRFGGGIEAGEATADGLVRKYPLGAKTTIRYRGEDSVLLPGPSGWLFVWIPLVGFIFGGIIYGLVTGT